MPRAALHSDDSPSFRMGLEAQHRLSAYQGTAILQAHGVPFQRWGYPVLKESVGHRVLDMESLFRFIWSYVMNNIK